jgi:hypothetical protein
VSIGRIVKWFCTKKLLHSVIALFINMTSGGWGSGDTLLSSAALSPEQQMDAMSGAHALLHLNNNFTPSSGAVPKTTGLGMAGLGSPFPQSAGFSQQVGVHHHLGVGITQAQGPVGLQLGTGGSQGDILAQAAASAQIGANSVPQVSNPHIAQQVPNVDLGLTFEYWAKMSDLSQATISILEAQDISFNVLGLLEADDFNQLGLSMGQKKLLIRAVDKFKISMGVD